MKKTKKRFAILFSLFMLITMIVPIDAAVTRLWTGTTNSWVSSEHGDNYFADKYIGRVSVRGSERFEGSKFIQWTRVTYDVQGDLSSRTISSMNPSDSVTRQASIEVSDKWNLGAKTVVRYKYGACYVSVCSPNAMSIEFEE